MSGSTPAQPGDGTAAAAAPHPEGARIVRLPVNSAGPARAAGPPPVLALSGRAFVVFACLWALATLFHQAGWPGNHAGPEMYLLTLGAVWVLLRPSSPGRFLSLLVLQLGTILYQLPRVSNHWLFTGFVAATILLAWGALAARRRSRRVSGSELFLAFAPVVRLELLVLYFYAVLHKLNADFLASDTSCAVEHYDRMRGALPFLPTGPAVQQAAIYGTLGIETAIPLLLLVRRTRLLGVALGTAFHLGLVFDLHWVFYDFSSLVYALYFLFIPYAVLEGLRGGADRSPRIRTVIAKLRSKGAQRALRGALFALGGVVLVGALVGVRTGWGPGDSYLVSELVQEGARVAFLGYGLIALAVLFLAWRSRDALRGGGGPVSLRPRTIAVAMVPVVFLNGLNPYLGLKTDTSFSMFSNLSTEGGRTNHLFMPVGYRLAGYQEDLVRVEQSSHPNLQRIAQAGDLLTFFHFRSITSRNPDRSVTYVRGGERHVVARVSEVPELAAPIPLLERKALLFRPVDASPAGARCMH